MSEISVTSGANTDRAALERRYLGRGLRLDQVVAASVGRDIDLVEGDNGRTFAMVDGVDNLAQDLELALLTPLTGDVFNLRFGFDGLAALTQDLEPALVEQLVVLSLRKTLAMDRRVERVESVEVSSDGPTRTMAVSAVVRTVTGGTLALQLTGMDLDGPTPLIDEGTAQ